MVTIQMNDQLYIRVRGRVLGRYDTAKLQSLAKRGQLSRMHEVSPDSINWVPASEYPKLFVGEDIPQAAASPQVMRPTQPTMAGTQELVPPAGRRWWYRKNDSQVGPVEEKVLQQYLTSGMLSPDDFVWADGMPQWLPARQVPELASPQTSRPLQGFQFTGNGAEDKGHDLPPSLCKAAANSRSWIIFIAVVAFVFAGLSIVGGIILLISAADHHLPPVVAEGLFGLVYGIDAMVGGSMLLSYANRLGGLQYGNKDIVLEKGLETLHTFWIYVSINLILMLGIIAFFAIWAIAFAGTIPIN